MQGLSSCLVISELWSDPTTGQSIWFYQGVHGIFTNKTQWFSDLETSRSPAFAKRPKTYFADLQDFSYPIYPQCIMRHVSGNSQPNPDTTSYFQALIKFLVSTSMQGGPPLVSWFIFYSYSTPHKPKRYPSELNELIPQIACCLDTFRYTRGICMLYFKYTIVDSR